jgi:hypothetical protein
MLCVGFYDFAVGRRGKTREKWEHSIATNHKLHSVDRLTDSRSIAGIAVGRA